MREYYKRMNRYRAVLITDDNKVIFVKPIIKRFTLRELQKYLKGYIKIHPVKMGDNMVIVNKKRLTPEMELNRTALLTFEIKVVGPALISPRSLIE